MELLLKILKIIGIIIIVGIIGIILIVISGFCGLILRWFTYLVCFIIDIFYDSVIIDWIGEHDTAMLVICSCVSALGIVLWFFGLIQSDGNSHPVYSPNYSHNNFNSYDTLNSCSNKNNIVFADASGSYRRWGDDFVDCKGNWCKWGTGFYDYDGNYIRWGNMYKDISGAYRRWGDYFVDGNGDWVHL